MTTPPSDETATAVDREAAWLSTSGDGLPALLKADGGPFDVVQAYWPGNRMATQKTGVYVLRTHLDDNHPMSQRYRPMYLFRLKVVWPVKAATAELAEQEQRALDVAIGFLLQRIRGPLGDKTHGARFLSVGETPGETSSAVDFDDPEQTIPANKELRATVMYYADDIEFND